MLLAAYSLHLAEEWVAGFSVWTRSVLGNEVPAERFVIINGAAFLLFVIGTAATLRSPRCEWFAVSFAALLGLNGILHALATLAFGCYSPGSVTGLLLYVPLSAHVMRASRSRLPAAVFAKAVVAGVLFHAAVFVAAFVG